MDLLNKLAAKFQSLGLNRTVFLTTVSVMEPRIYDGNGSHDSLSLTSHDFCKQTSKHEKFTSKQQLFKVKLIIKANLISY